MIFRNFLPVLIFVLFTGILLGQKPIAGDSVQWVMHTVDFQFADGIFLSVKQVKANSAVPTDRIVSELDRDNLDFYKQLMESEHIAYFDELGMKRSVENKDVWGYSSNGHLYINWNSEFNKIPVVGNVCHFVSNKTVYQNTAYDPYSYSRYGAVQMTPQRRVEMRQYIFDFETERVYDYDMQSLNAVLSRDGQLFEEWSQLKKRKKKDLKFVYIRKFNERNPLYIRKQ